MIKLTRKGGKNINQTFKNLTNKFRCIADKRWIKSVSKGHGTVGLTFEHELGKKVDTGYTPDYEDIEIKCSTRYSRHPISLFSVALDGPSNKEIIRLNDNYGNYDKDFPEKKTLIKTTTVGNLAELKSKYYLSLEIDDNKLFILIYDHNKVLLEKHSYVYLESIKKHLTTKLNNLAYIKASKKKIDEIEHFRYYEIYLYTIKNFDTFINLLKSGEIEVTLISRISKSGISAGRYHNKNLIFQIKKKNIEKLFDLIYYYNNDQEFSYNKYSKIDDVQFL